MPEITPEMQTAIMGGVANIIKALVLLVMVWIAAGWARRGTARGFAKANFDLTLSKFFSSIVRWAILLLGGLAVLGIFGVETASFAAMLAGAGLAVGMAFSGTTPFERALSRH